MKEFKRILIVIPTYNEAENIGRIIPQILNQDKRIDVLVIDDSSPDGTTDVVKKISQKEKKVHLIERPSKAGLGTAYIRGFRYAMENKYDLVFEMDADFSHDPKEIPVFISSMKTADLVIGSRYIRGVNVINWPMDRLILSWLANRYTRWITGMPLRDATSGYKCYRREVIEALDLDSFHSDGYGFQIEIDFKTWKKGFRLLEIPIVFVDRNAGVSKMNPHIVREAAILVWKLRIQSLIGKL